MWKRILAMTVLVASMLGAHLAFVRPWFAHWGATAADINRQWPDEVVPHPDASVTRAVTIAAPAEDVWRWVIQAGQDRAGWYSFRLLENLVGCRMPRTYRIVPEFQQRAVGDKVWMYPPDRVGGVGHAVVVRVDPGRALVLATAPIGSGPNLCSSGNLGLHPGARRGEPDPVDHAGRAVDPDSWRAVAFSRLVFDPVHFVMERKMMTTIKALAEGQDTPELPDIVQPLTRRAGFGSAASTLRSCRKSVMSIGVV